MGLTMRSAMLFLLAVFISPAICQQNIQIDLNGCGSTKTCVRYPTDCSSDALDCRFLATFQPDGQGAVNIELATKRNANFGNHQYMAVGFSKDEAMGDDAVTECIFSQQQIYLSYNPSKSNQRLSNTLKNQVISGTAIGSNQDDMLVCKFKQLIKPTINGADRSKVFDLDQDYFILLTPGRVKTDGNIAMHLMDNDWGPRVSSKKYNVASGSSVSSGWTMTKETKDSLKKAHGSIMIIAWFLFVANAILFARYGKLVFGDKKVIKLPIWFFIHRILNGLGIICVVVAFILIFVAEKGEWEGPKAGESLDPTKLGPGEKHSILGLTCSIIAFLQPIVVMLRCHPGTPKRPIFNWVHRILGIAGWCIAAVTIWYATYFTSHGLNADAPKGLIIFYFVAAAISVILMEVHITITERFAKQSRTQDIPMDHLHHKPQPPPPPATPKFAFLRIGVLLLFGLITLGVVIALLVFIGLSANK